MLFCKETTAKRGQHPFTVKRVLAPFYWVASHANDRSILAFVVQEKSNPRRHLTNKQKNYRPVDFAGPRSSYQ